MYPDASLIDVPYASHMGTSKVMIDLCKPAFVVGTYFIKYLGR